MTHYLVQLDWTGPDGSHKRGEVVELDDPKSVAERIERDRLLIYGVLAEVPPPEPDEEPEPEKKSKARKNTPRRKR